MYLWKWFRNDSPRTSSSTCDESLRVLFVHVVYRDTVMHWAIACVTCCVLVHYISTSSSITDTINLWSKTFFSVFVFPCEVLLENRQQNTGTKRLSVSLTFEKVTQPCQAESTGANSLNLAIHVNTRKTTVSLSCFEYHQSDIEQKSAIRYGQEWYWAICFVNCILHNPRHVYQCRTIGTFLLHLSRRRWFDRILNGVGDKVNTWIDRKTWEPSEQMRQSMSVLSP